MTTIAAMGLLDGKNIVITGVLTDASLAFGVAELAQRGGRRDRAHRCRPGAVSLTQRTARKLPDAGRGATSSTSPCPSTSTTVRDALAEQWGRVDGVLHAIGFAPAICLGDDFMDATWDDVAVAMQHLGLLATRRWPTRSSR